jgi:surfeit locus 1 family protein
VSGEKVRTAAETLLWPTVVMIPALCLLIGLGFWQWGRIGTKTELIASIASRAKDAPLAPELAANLRCRMADDGLERSCEFKRIRIRGAFDHPGERHIYAGVVAANAKPEVGYWVFTPFTPVVPGRQAPAAPILVNRGFVPERLKSPASRSAGQMTGEVEITAQIRTRQIRNRFDGQNDVSRNIYYVRDPGELGQRYGQPEPEANPLTAGWFYLEAIGTAATTDAPIPLTAVPSPPNRHLEYALTWWAFAASLAGVYIVFAIARLKERSMTTV